MRLTIIEWGPPVKHDTILYRTYVLLCVFWAIYTGPIHINHGLYRATPYNTPTNTFCTLQHLKAARKKEGGKYHETPTQDQTSRSRSPSD